MFYSGCESAERCVVKVAHKRKLRSAVNKNVCNDILIALSYWMTLRKRKDTGN